MVKDSPVWGDIWAKVAWAFEPTVCRNCEVADEPIIGYNLRTYDIPLIARECADVGILFQPGPIVDVHDLVCWHLRGLRKRTLGAACEHFGIAPGKAHNALADALAAIQVLKAMQTAGLVPTSLPELLVHSARIAVLIDAEWDKWEYYLYQRDGVVRVGFGKEIGRAISEVSAGWLGWALGELRAPSAVRDIWRMELLRRHQLATVETFQSIPT